MTKEESVQILQSYIDKLNNATSNDIEHYRKVYEEMCLNKENNKEEESLFECYLNL